MLARDRWLRWWPAAPLGLALLACGDDGPVQAAPPDPPPEPAAITLGSGDGQEGKAGERLPEPFVVRATDAGGDGVEGVQVTWRVTSGAGVLDPAVGGIVEIEPFVMNTSPDGMAGIYFEPTVLGTSTVVAEVPGLEGSPVTFATEATVSVIQVVFLFGCPGGALFLSGPDGTSDVTVPLGTPVEWTVVDDHDVSPECEVRITAFSAPADGEDFDSGILKPGERFEFVPTGVGTWGYRAEANLVDGTAGTLTVR